MASLFHNLSVQLKRIRDELGGYNHLEEDIRQKLQQSKPPITRRQLSRFCEGPKKALSAGQFDAVELYLRKKVNLGLPELWGQRSITSLLASTRNIAVVLGSQPEEDAKRIVLSRWDFRATRDLLNEIARVGYPRPVEVQDAIFRRKHLDAFQRDKPVEKELWHRMLLSKNGPSMVSIGSCRNSICSEVMIAQALGVAPFKPWPKERIDALPFAFVWPRRNRNVKEIPGCVRLDPFDHAKIISQFEGWTPQLGADLKDPDADTYALVSGKRIYRVCRFGKDMWPSYGIITARRLGHRIHVCVAGLTGPVTSGAIDALQQFAPDLELIPGSQQSETAWITVETQITDRRIVERTRKATGEISFPHQDERRPVSTKVLDGINVSPPWPPTPKQHRKSRRRDLENS